MSSTVQCMVAWADVKKLMARSVSRNRGSKMKASKAADKMSVSGMIHCSTQGHDLDQELVMEHAQTGREMKRVHESQMDRGTVREI